MVKRNWDEYQPDYACVPCRRDRLAKGVSALRVAEQYRVVDERVERLLEVVTELAKKGLSGDYEKKVKIEIRLPDFGEEHP